MTAQSKCGQSSTFKLSYLSLRAAISEGKISFNNPRMLYSTLPKENKKTLTPLKTKVQSQIKRMGHKIKTTTKMVCS
jgi:hypothetical protein